MTGSFAPPTFSKSNVVSFETRYLFDKVAIAAHLKPKEKAKVPWSAIIREAAITQAAPLRVGWAGKAVASPARRIMPTATARKSRSTTPRTCSAQSVRWR
ncbi:hypothetical protein E7V67_016250 [[Empedobacter] haloabium]|uniref:Uncharacterized protein n=1 Tax=[Empedobacter] haloabium TaxID=592317 RepID=A0ABZ1UGL6_9BURK